MRNTNCECSLALQEPLDEETRHKCLMERHVCTPWLLKWPYFQALGKVGRKYRISLSLDETLQDFESRLHSYTVRYTRRDQTKKDQTKKWCAAVLAKCRVNVKQALVQNLRPDGYDGLSKQFEEAKKILTFVPDDRGTHILHVCLCAHIHGFRPDNGCIQKWINVGSPLHKE